MAWNDDLTEEQIVAASHIGSHACLLAGPGTGKTRSLTRRIVYLITEERISPSSIIALTFTRAAAAELRNRVQSKLGEDYDLPHISTLHSFALSTILRQFSGTRLPQPIRIADDFEERYIIQEEIKRVLDINNIREIRDLMNQLSANWERLTADDPEWENRFPNPTFLGAWREHREIYGYILRSELVYQLKHAIDEGEIQLSEQTTHLLIDEYQDLNACDLAVVNSIASSEVELYAAGDDDQSIYGFRYANPEGIRRFQNEYQPSESLELQECMRCDRSILDLALYVARQDPRRIDKGLNCYIEAESGIVNILRFPDQNIEANNIAQICSWLIAEQKIQSHEILLLLRTDRNQQFSTPLRSALLNQNLPITTVANPLAPIETIEGRHFFCLLKLIDNERDHLAWRTLLDIRRNGIGELTLSNLYDIARMNGQTFYDALMSVSSNPSLIPRSGSTIQREFENIRNVINDVSEDDLSDLESFVHSLANEQIENESIRTEVLGIFHRVLEEGPIEDLDQLLRAINISLDNNEQERESGSINIMTMHQAKGLSADAVFIVAAEDEYIPGRATGEQIGDERRLLYVSLTRARHFLYITHCQNRTGVQRHSGRTSGNTRRNLTSFLSGGPISSQSGITYINSL